MKQTITIDVPNGYKAILKNNKVELVKIESQLPNTWEEFCKTYPISYDEYFINNYSAIWCTDEEYYGNERSVSKDKNLLPSKEAAIQHLALTQLHQLRDCYRQGWTPSKNEASFIIIRRIDGGLGVIRQLYSSGFLSFQSNEIAEKFLSNFRGLIKEAGDLI